MKKSQRILLPIFNGIRARNFFQTDVFSELIRGGAVLIILAPSHKIEYYRETYGRPGVEFAPWEDVNESYFGKMLITLAFNALGTNTIRQKQYAMYIRDGNAIAFFFRRLVTLVFGKSAWFRKFIRYLDRFVPDSASVQRALLTHQPDLVIVPDIVFQPDRLILRQAKRMKIPTIGMLRSWDNLTSKGVIQILPDYLIVQTSLMKQEAIELADMPEERIAVCGVPQFDMYFKEQTGSREAFVDSLGIPRDRRLVLCAPFFDMYSNESGIAIVNALARAIETGRLPDDVHLLVRFRPESYDGDTTLERQMIHPNVTVTKPTSIRFPRKDSLFDFEFSEKDTSFMLDSLRFSAVTINTISTLTIDASALDRPVINVRFDGDPNTPARYSVALFSDFDHYKLIEEAKGVSLAYSPDELIAAINRYLDNPALDAVGRARIRNEQIEFLDGKSGLRTAKAILSFLESSSAERS